MSRADKIKETEQQNLCSTLSTPKYISESYHEDRRVRCPRLKSMSPYTNLQVKNAQIVKRENEENKKKMDETQKAAYDAIISERERGFLLNNDNTIMNALLARDRTPKQRLVLLQHELRDKSLPQNVEISSDFARPRTPSQVQDNRDTMRVIKAIGGFQNTLTSLLDKNDQDNVSIKKALAIQQMEDTKFITSKTFPRVE